MFQAGSQIFKHLAICAFWKLNKAEKTSYFTSIKERNTGQQLCFTANISRFVVLMAKAYFNSE